MRHGILDPADNSPSGSAGGPAAGVRARFEDAWKSATSEAARPHIHDYLATIPEDERPAVFSALLALELKCRQADGELPTQEEYHRQFPESGQLIQIGRAHV